MELESLVQADLQATIEFFYFNLKEEAEVRKKNEIAYVASILASYAHTPIRERSPYDVLTRISEKFALSVEPVRDPNTLACAGAEVIFFAGFFRDQMRRRHDPTYFDYLGRSFYQRAGIYTNDERKRELFGGIAANFPLWTETCAKLNKTFQESRYLLEFS